MGFSNARRERLRCYVDDSEGKFANPGQSSLLAVASSGKIATCLPTIEVQMFGVITIHNKLPAFFVNQPSHIEV